MSAKVMLFFELSGIVATFFSEKLAYIRRKVYICRIIQE